MNIAPTENFELAVRTVSPADGLLMLTPYHFDRIEITNPILQDVIAIQQLTVIAALGQPKQTMNYSFIRTVCGINSQNKMPGEGYELQWIQGPSSGLRPPSSPLRQAQDLPAFDKLRAGRGRGKGVCAARNFLGAWG